MSFVAAYTTIPVSKIYDTLAEDKRVRRHVMMEYMQGEQLDKVWQSLTPAQKEMTCHQLGGFIAQLQHLRGSRVEAANGESVNIILGSGRENGGPFDTVGEFNDWLVDGVFHRITPPRFKENCRAALSDHHDLCFAHGDFAPRNILVDETGHVTAVLDWEMAGWFPAYWDIGKVLVDLPESMPDYRFYLHHIVPLKHANECLAMYQLERYYPPV
jgi:aminoglycoside phosphotransferase (APT) family kinase protein